MDDGEHWPQEVRGRQIVNFREGAEPHPRRRPEDIAE